MIITDRNGRHLAPGDYVLRWYVDGSHAEGVVIAFEGSLALRDAIRVRIALDGNCDALVRSTDVEFVHRPGPT